MLPSELTSERLHLAPPTNADIAEVYALCQDPTIQQWTTLPTPYQQADAEFFITDAAERWAKGDATWVIRRLHSDSCEPTPIMGAISLHRDQPGGVVAEIGYWLGSEYRGHGYMNEAATLAIDYAFTHMQLESILWRGAVIEGVPNWPSWKIAWSLGFTLAGTVHGMHTNKGELRDCMVATLHRDDSRSPQHAWHGPADNHPAYPNPRDPEALVRQFHETYGLPIVTDGPNADRERIHMRLALIAEEFTELIGAALGPTARATLEEAWNTAREQDEHVRDTVEVADALGDLIYVIYGAALELGLPMEDVLAEIQASNLSKLGADGKPIYREDGKVLKGPGYFRPNIARVLGLESDDTD